MEKFKGRYRIPPARAQWWNYGWDAAYFLTICTKGHDMFFGEIIDDEMVLSEVGKTAELCWQEIPKHAKNIELGVYVVMPNHVHGILILHGDADPGTHVAPMGRDKACLVSAETSSGHRIPGESRSTSSCNLRAECDNCASRNDRQDGSGVSNRYRDMCYI
jgi:REP element-mobilizing transposase RayT